MKEYVLNYYPNFKCVAENCKHSCCVGWKINIDKESLKNYRQNNTVFKKTLQNGINFKKSKFKMNKDKRCAFLNEKGLCEIILNLGEKSLCQVCKDHPRFRSFFNNRTEMGLGFCCEEATRIILSFKEKIRPLLVIDDKENEQLDFTQQNVIEFREKALNLLQDRSVLINQRLENLLSLCKAKVNEKDFIKTVKLFLSLERLEKGWTKRLKAVKKKTHVIKTNENLTCYCEQFLVNELYRHLSDAEDTMWVRARTIACVLTWWVIQSVYQNEAKEKSDFKKICDIIREYSSEVEYSQKNLEKLYQFAYNFICI